MYEFKSKDFIPPSSTAIWLGNQNKMRYLAYLMNGRNAPLFQQLWSDGFFILHSTNSGRIVYHHQIVAFYFCGGKQLQEQGVAIERGDYEIHHVNGNTFDNTPRNLVYVDSHTHSLITTVQRKYSKGRLPTKDSEPVNQLDDAQVWNRRGVFVRNKTRWFIALIARTIVETCKYLGVNPPVKQIINWYRKLRKQLLCGFDASVSKLLMLFTVMVPLSL